MSIYRRKNKKGKPIGNYIVDFIHHGKRVREFLRTEDRKAALKIERELRAKAEQGIYGLEEIRADNPEVPTLGEFIKEKFWTYVEGHYHQLNTFIYYRSGMSSLLDSSLAERPLDSINSQHTTAYAAEKSDLGWRQSTINRDLRTLKLALRFAQEWGIIDRIPTIHISGEAKRCETREILSRETVCTYLEAAKKVHQDWYDCALLLAGTGLRPSEAYTLRWENVFFNEPVKIRITESKTAAGKRTLPLAPVIYQRFQIPDVGGMLRRRFADCERPTKGFVFARPDSSTGHLTEGTAKGWHSKTLARLAKAHKEKPEEHQEVKPFEPYMFRHSFLTWLAPYLDAFALAKWAGHSNISITKRYVQVGEKMLEDSVARIESVPTIAPTTPPLLPTGQ